MKTRNKGILLLIAVAFIIVIVVWFPVSRFKASSRAYREAEPLVQVIWPMADEMKHFSDERGRPPTSLDEISRFSPQHDFSALRPYPHEFTTTGPRRFFLHCNSRFAFVIDEHYAPAWIFPPSVFSTPTNPK